MITTSTSFQVLILVGGLGVPSSEGKLHPRTPAATFYTAPHVASLSASGSRLPLLWDCWVHLEVAARHTVSPSTAACRAVPCTCHASCPPSCPWSPCSPVLAMLFPARTV